MIEWRREVPFVVALMTLTLLALCVGRRFALFGLLLLLLTILADARYVCFIRDASTVEHNYSLFRRL